MANVYDPWGVALSNQPVEQRHLAMNVTDFGDSREFWQIVDQLRSFVSQVEGRYGSIFDHIELSEQPRN